jgi:hypothetical protein
MSSKAAIAAVLFMLSLEKSFAQTVAPIDPKLGVLFPPGKARLLLRQCSRSVPGGDRFGEGLRTWMPSNTDIRQLEKRLHNALVAAQPKDMPIYTNYARQYAGIVLHGRKLVYVNAFAAGGVFLSKDTGKRVEYSRLSYFPRWREEVIAVCDGGPTNFGAVYDPQTTRFEQFAFSGSI